MAEKKKRGPVTNPSAAQRRAWAKLGRMAKARGKAARAAKRNTGTLLTDPIKKRTANKGKGKRRNSEHKDSAHPVAVRRYYRSGGPGYMTPWQRAETHGQQRLFQMNSGRRRRNDEATAAAEVNAEFLGRKSAEVYEAVAPSGTPAHLGELGLLRQIKTAREVLSFAPEDNYVLCADADRRLHIVCSTAERFELGADLGEIRQVTYFAVKQHLDNAPIEYYHDFNPQRPRLATDGEGLLLIVGGNYNITAAGIEG